MAEPEKVRMVPVVDGDSLVVVSSADLQRVVREVIEEQLWDFGSVVVPSEAIARLVVDRLQRLPPEPPAR